MRIRQSALSFFLLCACLLSAGPRADGTAVVALLDRYSAGEFEPVAEYLAGDISYQDVLQQLRRDAPAWIDAGGGDRARRELTAATFALEAARAGSWHEWKIIKRQPLMWVSTPDEAYQPPSVLSWNAPPLLIEWGCALLRRHPAPLPIERWWQLAALAVAQRAEDPAFLIGHVNLTDRLIDQIGNTQDEIRHLDHVQERFPQEVRFMLAQGMARERDLPGQSVMAYRALEADPDVGGEAMMRLGALQVRRQSMVATPYAGARRPENASDALRSLERAQALTRDPYVVFLARYFSGQVLERQNRAKDAEAAYRAAVAAIPHARSATIALASLLFKDGRRLEAQRLIDGMLAAEPRPVDPWRAYAHADDRFWPRLIARLRAEIHR